VHARIARKGNGAVSAPSDGPRGGVGEENGDLPGTLAEDHGVKRRRTAIRVAAAVAGAALLVFAVAIVAVPPWLLRSRRLLTIVNENPVSLRIEYSAARSAWPGRIAVDGLEIRGSDPNVQWWFRMDHAEIRYSLMDLAARKFHATSVRASGLSFRLRQRLSRGNRTPGALAPLPPIPGFGETPEVGGPPYYRPPEPPSNYWGVEVDDLVAAPATQIWIDAYRFDGRGRVSGRFALHPQKVASVGPASIDFDQGRLAIGREIAAEPFRARVEGTIATFDPRQVRGNEVYRYVSGKGTLSGEMPNARFLNFYLRSAPEPRLADGRGTIRGNLGLRLGKGEIELTLAARRLEARYRKGTIAGDATLRFRLSPWTPAEAVGRVDGSTLELRRVSSGAGGADEWWGKFSIGPGTLASRPGGLELATRIGVLARDARPLYTLFGVGLPKWAQGLARMESLTATASVTLGPSIVDVRNLEAAGGKLAIAGDYRSRGATSDGAFLVSSGKLAAGVEIRAGKPAIKLTGAQKWFASRGRPQAR
jgi:hypothetical protein